MGFLSSEVTNMEKEREMVRSRFWFQISGDFDETSRRVEQHKYVDVIKSLVIGLKYPEHTVPV